MSCAICGHPEHEANKCKSCNCGESDVSRSSALESDRQRVVTYQDHKRGQVSIHEIARVRPRRTGWD